MSFLPNIHEQNINDNWLKWHIRNYLSLSILVLTETPTIIYDSSNITIHPSLQNL